MIERKMPNQPERKAPHILVVEDEAIVAMQICKTLRRLGYTTATVPTGEEAVAIVPNEKPDLALMDIMLAGDMDGIQAAARIARQHGTPIVYLTANADENTVNRAKLTEPYGYILKPFNESRLKGAIDLAIQRHAIQKRIKNVGGGFHAAMEVIEDAVFTADTNGRLMYMNLAAETLVGSKLDPLRGTELAELFKSLDEEKREIIRKGVADAVASNGTVDLASHHVLVSMKGPALTVHSVVPIGASKDAAGGVLLVLRKMAEPDKPPVEIELPPLPPPDAESQSSRKALAELIGLPPRAEAEKAIEMAFNQGTHQFAVAFVLDRFELIRYRFGTRAAHEVLQFYSIHVAQSMGPTDLLFQWSDPSFVMLLDRTAAVPEVRREISSWAGLRMEKIVEANSRSVMLIVSGKWQLFDPITTVAPDKIIEQIDGFIGGASARQATGRV